MKSIVVTVCMLPLLPIAVLIVILLSVAHSIVDRESSALGSSLD